MSAGDETGPRRASAGRRASAAVACGAAFGLALTLLPDVRWLQLVVDNGVQLVAACLAAAAWAQAAARRGPDAVAWSLLALGTGCWAVGQAVWTVYEVGLGREVPFPSPADALFLLLPASAGAGLVRWLHDHRRATARARDVLDALLIATSLLTLSWATVISAVHSDGQGEGAWALGLLLAYPVADVALVTLVLLALSKASPGRRGVLVLLAAGLGGLAVADSAYLYLVSTGAYGSGNLLSVGWVTGFLLLAAAARTTRDARPAAPAPASQAPATPAPAPQALEAVVWWAVLLPYLPLVGAGTVVGVRVLQVPGVPRLDLALGASLTALVLGRQFFAHRENRRLLVELGRARDQLQHAATHDALTGCANRLLFRQRLEAAAARGGVVRVLFCDLDGFKDVNDRHGHAAGDELLRLVADRCRSVLRPPDVLARLGGDEFAVLLAPDSADDVPLRLVEVVGRSSHLTQDGRALGMTVGAARLDLPGPGSEAGCDDPAEVARRLLAEADADMYLKKALRRAAARGAAAAAPPLPAPSQRVPA